MTRAQQRFMVMGILLSMACCWLYLSGHARYGLFDVDEAIFTQATIEMRHNEATGISSLAMPTYNGEPRYHKPPLIYWMQDAAMSVLGEDSLYAARLPSALGALGTILLLGFGVARLTGSRRWGLMSAMVMGLNLSFLIVGRAATADGLLNVTSLALALWVLHICFPGTAVLAREEHGAVDADVFGARLRKVAARTTAQRRQWIITGILAALGFLAKGPVAWIPAVLMVGALLLVRKDKAEVWQKLSPVKSGLLVLALLVPWMGLLLVQHGFGFFYEFFIVHNLGRYAGGLSNTQSSSPFYYLIVMLFGFFPWVFFLPKALRMTLKGGIRKVRRALNGNDPGRALPVLAVVWAVGYIVFFSFSQTKLAHYIVPAYPALAILVGALLAQMPRVKLPAVVTAAGVMFGLLLATLMLVLDPLLLGLREPVLTGWLATVQAVLGIEWPPHDVMAQAVLAERVPLDAAPVVIGALLILCVLPAWVMVARAQRGGIVVLAGTWAVCLGLIGWGVVPMIWNYTQAPLAQLAQVIAQQPRTTPIIHLGMHKPSVLYLSERPFLKLEKPLQLPGYATAPETMVLTEQESVMPIVTELGIKRDGSGGGAQVMGQKCLGGYCLLIVSRLAPPADIAY
jgi:4-amino-4-deoxy-L-arabinose transferase-like glycosyltransferase